MELDFLAEKTEQKKSEPKVTDIKYDKEQANIEPNKEREEKIKRLTLQYPFLQRAIEHAIKYGYTIAANLKEAMIARRNGELKVTLHEADICLRQNINLSSEMIKTSFLKFGHFITEEDYNFTGQIFVYRTRYNKGIEWKRKFFDSATKEQKYAGLNKLHEIIEFLDYSGLPIHPEEEDIGFLSEFLKPEYMDWNQFNTAIRTRTGNYLSIQDRNTMDEFYEKFRAERNIA